MPPAFPSDLTYAGAMGVPDIRQRKCAPRDSFVPRLATARSGGGPTRTSNRYEPPSITGSTYASFPFFVDSMNVETKGTSTCEYAGFGLFTVRAHNQAITVSLRSWYCFRSGRSWAISLVTLISGYRRPMCRSASSRIHWP